MDIKYTQKQFDKILELERRGGLDDYPNSKAWLEENRRMNTQMPYKVPKDYYQRNDMAQGKVSLAERTIEPLQRGMKQPFKGLTQFSTNVQAGMGLLPQQQADQMNKEITEDQEQYAPLLQESGLAQTADIVGNIAGEAPMMAIPATKYPKLAAAGVGALTGMVQPTEVQEGESYAGNKTGQVGLSSAFGLGFGALFQFAGPKVVTAYNKLHKWIKTNKGVSHFEDYVKGGDFTRAGRDYFKSEGLPIDDLNDDLRKKFAADIQSALETGDGGLEGDALMRYLRAKGVGVNLTLGQATKEPVHQATELAGMADTTHKYPLIARKEQQNAAIAGSLELLRKKHGVPSNTTPESVGKTLKHALKKKAQELQGPVANAYKYVDEGDGATAMAPTQLFNKIWKLEESGRSINIKGFKGLKAELEHVMKEAAENHPGKYGSGKVSAKTYEEMHKKISKMMKQAKEKGDANTADALSEILATRGDDYGSQFGYDVYAKPRALAEKRFNSYGTKGMKDVIDTTKHDHKMENIYTAMKGATNGELRMIKKFLKRGGDKAIKRGTAAWNKVSGYELTKLIDGSFEKVGEEGGERIFSISKFKNILKGYRDSGSDKIFWGPEIRKQLALMEKVGEDRLYKKTIMGSQGSPTAALVYELKTRGAEGGAFSKLVKLITRLIPVIGTPIREATEANAERVRRKGLGKDIARHLDPNKYKKTGANELNEAELLWIEKMVNKARSVPGVSGSEGAEQYRRNQ
jgi:hypothetical protein